MSHALLFATLLAAAPLPVMALDLHLPWQSAPAEVSQPPRPVVSEMLSDSAARPRPVPGFIAAHNEVALAFLTLGRVTDRLVDLGDEVTTGQPLARLDPEDLDGQVRAAEAALAAAEAQHQTATITAARTRQLAARDVASASRLEQVEAALAAAKAQLDQARAQLIRARDQQGFAELTAPFDGVITAVLAEPGEVVQAGAPVLNLSGNDMREALIDLTEGELAGMLPGTAWHVWQEGEPTHRVTARVARIAPLADQRTRTRRVQLTLPADAPFRLGALIRAARVGDSEASLTLPASAILQPPAAPKPGPAPEGRAALDIGPDRSPPPLHDGPAQVWVVTRPEPGARSGTVALHDVTIALRPDGRVSVTGLPDGTEIVTRGVHSLTEGQTVAQSVSP